MVSSAAPLVPGEQSDERAYFARDLDDERDSVECSFVAVHRIRVTWESSQVRTAFGRQCLPRSDST